MFVVVELMVCLDMFMILSGWLELRDDGGRVSDMVMVDLLISVVFVVVSV